MSDESKFLLDLDIDGSVVRITVDEARALFITLQDALAEIDSEKEGLLQ